MDIKAELVKDLREKTGAGFMDCKAALVESKGDFEKAVEILRIKGIAKASKRAGKVAKDGIVYSYIHPGSRVGVMIEMNCETDFVARNEGFVALAKDIAMQIAAASPRFLDKESVPSGVIESEKRIYEQQVKDSGKPEKALPKIVEGRMQKFYQENCLIDQPFIKDESKSVGELIKDSIAKIGENISVRRFTRYQVGEGIEDHAKTKV